MPLIENWIAWRTINGSLFWRRAIPAIYLYKRSSIRRVRRNGIDLQLDLSNLVDHCIFFGVPPQVGWRNLLKLATANSVVFDVGANMGFLTLSFAQTCHNGWVYSFEPGKMNFERLQQNIQLNNFNNITTYPVALGESVSAKKLFELYAFNTGANRILESLSDLPADVVSVNTLDNVVAQMNLARVDILKIDVEGYELFVLQGAEKTIRQFRPILFLELADDNLSHHQLSSKDVLHYLKELSYSVFHAETMQPFIEAGEKVHLDVLCFPHTD